MKKLGVTASLVTAVSLSAAFAFASAGAAGITADEALGRLLEGNKRFVESKMSVCGETTAAAREKLANSQKPYAIILSCSDSRVPPEIVFDKSLGEIFVVRVAGNVPDPVVLGSVEYAAEHLGSPLVMVLGHERCGAVTATVDANGKGEGNIGAIVKGIAPALKKAKQDKNCDRKDKGKLVECVVDANAKLVAKNLTKQSKIIRELVHEGKLKIVAAKYDLDDGKVTVFDGK
ncbi:MAG TPA: carbonic anhydrase [Geobacteraceae bacterium]|nr:carbonic anhydrase [Geobacteraceae bacterium]